MGQTGFLIWNWRWGVRREMAEKKTATKKTARERATAEEVEMAGAPVEDSAEAPPESDKKRRVKRVARVLSEVAKRRLIRTLIKQAADKLEQESGKTTMGDLIRLLNLEKELGRERPTKITVQWIDPRTGKPWVNES
jgi:hypothetical protein